jgi:hypothetical protein
MRLDHHCTSTLKLRGSLRPVDGERFDFSDQDKRARILAFNNFCGVGVGGPGIGTLKLEGKVDATKTMLETLPISLQWDGCFDIGSDTRIGVNDCNYTPPFQFTGDTHQGDQRVSGNTELVLITCQPDRPVEDWTMPKIQFLSSAAVAS